MKRIKYIGVMIIISLILVSCKGNVESNKVVKIEYVYDDGEEILDDYKYLYDDGSDSNEITKFTSNFDLDKVEIVGLEYEDELVEKEILNTYDLKSGEILAIRAVYPEGIPMIKIKWQVDGKRDEYIIQYNGKDGMKELIEYTY